ncbi:MAG: tRNA dihydrouridine synthase DusB [Deltaproteobacteria bacterium]|nr:tRNA dihydrouridine synthase DusB [Deltaproteobacteria bacterium]
MNAADIHPLHLEHLKLENNLMLAPLAGITDLLFRVIVKRYGCGLVFSEMINSNGVLHGGLKVLRKMDIHPEEHPVGIQIAGDDPKTLSQVASMAQDAGAALININMGCPAKKVTKSKAGCILMRDPKLVETILLTIQKSISIPLTIKIRLGWDEQELNYPEIAKIAEACGCAFVILHARTRTQAFKGQARWEEIRKLKETIKIPVIGNGDITTCESAVRMFQETGCDGIMIGRGALGQPWLFQEIKAYAPPKQTRRIRWPEIKNIILEHLALSVERYGEPLGVKLMRKHFAWYSHGLPKSSAFRYQVHQFEREIDTRQFIESFFDSISGKDFDVAGAQTICDLPLGRQVQGSAIIAPSANQNIPTF